jgi:hypothetical protein
MVISALMVSTENLVFSGMYTTQKISDSLQQLSSLPLNYCSLKLAFTITCFPHSSTAVSYPSLSLFSLILTDAFADNSFLLHV